MIMKVVLDASVWVSSLRLQDVNHNASRLWIEQYITRGGLFIAPALLLIEVAAAISRRTGQKGLVEEAVRKLETTPAISIVPVDSTLVQATIGVVAHLQLRAGDAIYVAVAHLLSVPLVSWDKEQLQRASVLVTTYTPDNYSF